MDRCSQSPGNPPAGLASGIRDTWSCPKVSFPLSSCCMTRSIVIPRPNQYYKLPRNVGLIPAGIYQLDAIDASGVQFKIEDQVRFRIFNHDMVRLREVPQEGVARLRTSAVEFATKTKGLLIRLRSSPPDAMQQAPRTLSYIDPQIRCAVENSPPTAPPRERKARRPSAQRRRTKVSQRSVRRKQRPKTIGAKTK